MFEIACVLALDGNVPVLSTDGFDGGVSRLPTLTLAGGCCGAMALIPALGWVLDDVTYLCEDALVDCWEGGGGSSKLGRFEAAGRRAVSGCEG